MQHHISMLHLEAPQRGQRALGVAAHSPPWYSECPQRQESALKEGPHWAGGGPTSLLSPSDPAGAVAARGSSGRSEPESALQPGSGLGRSAVGRSPGEDIGPGSAPPRGSGGASLDAPCRMPTQSVQVVHEQRNVGRLVPAGGSGSASLRCPTVAGGSSGRESAAAPAASEASRTGRHVSREGQPTQPTGVVL